MKKIIYVFLAGCLFAACNQDDCNLGIETTSEVSQTVNHRVSIEQAKANAVEFVSKLQSKTRSYNPQSLEVENVQAISFRDVVTRSDGDSINLDSLLYIVNFADSCGFVIAGTDDREKAIYAYIENGNYSWEDTESMNDGFKAFIYSLLELKSYDAACEIPKPDDGTIGGGPGAGGGYEPDKFEVMYPLLKTKWGQREPFNEYVPNHYRTGCVVTAISQICSYLELPYSVDWTYNNTHGSATFNWAMIKSECENLDIDMWSADCKDQIAHLMRYWGLAFQADYSADGTGVDSDDAIKLMKNDGFSISGLHDYNSGDVIDDLKAGNRIVFMRGNGRYYHVGFVFRKYVDGHAWVADGYIDEVNNSEHSYYLHCNWGWYGISNGYYLCDAFDTDNGPVYNDNATRSNYQYNLEFATFFK